MLKDSNGVVLLVGDVVEDIETGKVGIIHSLLPYAVKMSTYSYKHKTKSYSWGDWPSCPNELTIIGKIYPCH